MIIHEIVKSIEKFKIFSAFIFIQLVVTSIVCNLVIDTITSMKKDQDRFNQAYSQKKYFWMVENIYDNEKEKLFFKSEDSYQRLINFYKDMKTSDDYRYLEIAPQQITINSEQEGFVYANNYSVDLNCLNEFQIKVYEGRLFTEEEMTIDFSSKTIPVILGYNLRDRYMIGDVFEGTYFLRKMNFEVIGILEKNSRLIRNNIVEAGEDPSFYFEYLDNSFITPLVNCEDTPKDKNERLFQRIIYQMKLNPTIVASEYYNAGNLREKIDRLIAKYDLYDFEVIQISNNTLNLLKLVSQDSIDIMTIFAVILLGFSIISIGGVLYVKLSKKIPDYAVHLIVGATKRRIITYLVTEMIAIFLISHIFSFFITKKLFPVQVSYSLTWIIISVIACIGACIIPIYKLTNQNIDSLLKGDLYV